MNRQTGVSPDQIEFISSTVRALFPGIEVILFGSRIDGGFKPSSDLDVCLKGLTELPLAKLEQLHELLSNSDLPFKVDIVDFSRTDDDFKKIILKPSHPHIKL